jgi:hypothetical protein
MRRSKSERLYIYSSGRVADGLLARGIFLLFLISATALFSCSQSSGGIGIASTDARSATSRATLEHEYRQYIIRINLAKTRQPYLVLDFPAERISIMMDGAVIWDSPLRYTRSNPQRIESFCKKFLGSQDQFVRRLQGKYLYAAGEKIPDSILIVVANALEMDPALLQRELPRKFRLQWKGSLLLEVRADIKGSPKAVLKNLFADVQRRLLYPLGNSSIVVSMAPEAALTLYRAASRGMYTLIIPPEANAAYAGN